MAKVVITADIHGIYSVWEKFTKMIGPGDILVVAGDLYDTRYGNSSVKDFSPEKIREEAERLSVNFAYVYGNCDNESFYPGFSYFAEFKYKNKNILVHHGHISGFDTSDFSIVIQGHTHVKRLEKASGKLFINPGSPVLPRDNVESFAIIENNEARLIDFYTNDTLKSVSF